MSAILPTEIPNSRYSSLKKLCRDEEKTLKCEIEKSSANSKPSCCWLLLRFFWHTSINWRGGGGNSSNSRIDHSIRRPTGRLGSIIHSVQSSLDLLDNHTKDENLQKKIILPVEMIEGQLWLIHLWRRTTWDQESKGWVNRLQASSFNLVNTMSRYFQTYNLIPLFVFFLAWTTNILFGQYAANVMKGKDQALSISIWFFIKWVFGAMAYRFTNASIWQLLTDSLDSQPLPILHSKLKKLHARKHLRMYTFGFSCFSSFICFALAKSGVNCMYMFKNTTFASLLFLTALFTKVFFLLKLHGMFHKPAPKAYAFFFAYTDAAIYLALCALGVLQNCEKYWKMFTSPTILDVEEEIVQEILIQMHLDTVVILNSLYLIPITYRFLVDADVVLRDKSWGFATENVRILNMVNAILCGVISFLLYGPKKGLSSTILTTMGMGVQPVLIQLTLEIYRSVDFFERVIWKSKMKLKKRYFIWILIVACVVYHIFTGAGIFLSTAKLITILIVISWTYKEWMKGRSTSLWLELTILTLFTIGVGGVIQLKFSDPQTSIVNDLITCSVNEQNEITINSRISVARLLTRGELDTSQIVQRSNPYVWCDWIPLQYNISLVELDKLALLGYYNPEKECFKLLFDRVVGTGWKYHAAVNMGEVSNPAFFHFHHAEKKLHVISVRGTNPLDMFDVLQDIFMYNQIFLFQAVSFFFPPLRLTDPFWISLMIKAMSIGVLESDKQSSKKIDLHLHSTWYAEMIEAYVKKLYDDPDISGDILLTGHSLGGGVAKIAGSRMGILTVAFQAPGIVHSRLAFGVTKTSIDKWVINVASPSDPVAQVDQLGGVLFMMDCTMRNSVSCHIPTVALCDLFNRCGSLDPREPILKCDGVVK